MLRILPRLWPLCSAPDSPVSLQFPLYLPGNGKNSCENFAGTIGACLTSPSFSSIFFCLAASFLSVFIAVFSAPLPFFLFLSFLPIIVKYKIYKYNLTIQRWKARFSDHMRLTKNSPARAQDESHFFLVFSIFYLVFLHLPRVVTLFRILCIADRAVKNCVTNLRKA